MTFRPQSQNRKIPTDALEYEIAQEQAAALGRLGRALEAALAGLSEYDQVGGGPASSPGTRDRLVQKAGYALWCFVIQREVCGLRDQRLVIRDYRAPRDVQNRMGILGNSGRRPPERS
jgi:hypothetical protein